MVLGNKTHARLGFDKQNQHSSAAILVSTHPSAAEVVRTRNLFGWAAFALPAAGASLVRDGTVLDVVQFATARSADVTFSGFPAACVAHRVLDRAVANKVTGLISIVR